MWVFLPSCMSVHMHAGALRGQKRASSDHLELELQPVVSHHVDPGKVNPGPLKEQPLLLTAEPSC